MRERNSSLSLGIAAIFSEPSTSAIKSINVCSHVGVRKMITWEWSLMPDDWLLTCCVVIAVPLALWHHQTTDYDACRYFRCRAAVHSPWVPECQDISGGPKSQDGRRCPCDTGMEYDELVGCTSINGKKLLCDIMTWCQMFTASCCQLYVCMYTCLQWLLAAAGEGRVPDWLDLFAQNFHHWPRAAAS
jgi:hypothetical protein